MPAKRPQLIAHVINRLDVGGLENGLVNLVNRMPADRYRHAIVCMTDYTDFRRRVQREDVEVHAIGKRPGKDLGAYGRLWRLMKRLRPSVIHTRNLGTVDAQWVAFCAGVPRRVHGEHGWDAADPQGLNTKSLRIRRMCRPVTHRYVAVSKDLARWLEGRVGVPQTRIRQIYNGVDLSRFNPDGPVPEDLPWAAASTRPVVIGTLGRLDPVKNQIALLDAFAALVAQSARDGLRLAIVGGGPMESQLRARAQELGVAHLVWMPGARSDTPAILRAFDIFVLPSLNEGISNTILEAMATLRPVIAAAVGGNPELIENQSTGTLYEPARTQALMDALAAYVTQPGMRAAHGAAGRQRAVQRFGLDSMVNEYLQLYDGLLAS